MKKVRSFLCLAMALILFASSFPVSDFAIEANAATTINYSPYPKVEYSYSSGVSVGTIRYIAQNSTSPYFNWNYWPRNSFGGYGSPESECGTACISMALSYVGVDRTPKVLLESTNGYTGSMWGQQGNANSKSISKSTSAISNAMSDYINGNGKYSPLCVYIVPFSSTSSMHWVLLVGKIDNNKYLALNPWHTSGTNGTFTIQINGTTATYNGTTNPISSVNQWYNPNASIASPEPTEIIYPNNGGIYKIAYGGGNNMYLDFALSSNNVQIYENCDGHSDPAFVKSQYFKLTHVGDGWYSIINIGNGKAVDIAGINPTSGTNIQQWEYLGNNGQLYRFYDAGNGYCYIKSKLGTYVDKKDGDTSNDTNVWSYAFNGTVAQKWKLMLIEDIISTDESKSINNKHFTNAEKLSFSGWAFSNRGKSVTFKYVLDSSSPVTVKNCNRPDVKKVYSQSCAYTDVGYGFSIDLSELSVGKHTMKIIATSFFGTELVVSNLCFYVDEHSHTYLIIGYNPASCTLDGMQTSECEICKDKKTVKINKLGHDYDDWITVKEATCTQAGIEQKTCKRCNNIQTQSIPATGHDYVSSETASTCTSDGFVTRTCTLCGDSLVDSLINAEGQKWGDWTETKKPTQTEDGEEERICTVCGENETRAVDRVVFVIGDVDGDGIYSSADARLALRASVGLEILTPEERLAADVDGDGTISSADARLILRASVGLESLDAVEAKKEY